LLLTKLSELELEEAKLSGSPIAMSFHTSPKHSSFQTVYKEVLVNILVGENSDNGTVPERSVTATIVQEGAEARQACVDINMPVASVANEVMAKKAVINKLEAAYGMRPRYLRYNVWSEEEKGNENGVMLIDCLADWTERVKPLPTVPATELANAEAMSTIREWGSLFEIVTPINVDRFEALLTTHLNQPFVESVCRGFREGFWPWANTRYEEYPSIVDESLGMPTKPEEAIFLHEQRDHERSKGRFSGSFG
jgi:hypothetical protein